jgi:hypothetical protein
MSTHSPARSTASIAAIVAFQNGSNRGLDIGSADCTDITLGLCDDDIRVQLFERVIVDLVYTKCILHEPANISIDLDTGSILVKLGRRADRQGANVQRIVALV